MSSVVATSVTGGPFVPPAAPLLSFWTEIRQLFPTDASFRAFRDFTYGKYEAFGYAEGLSMEETASFVLFCWDMQDARLTSPFQRLNKECGMRRLSPECVSFYHTLRSGARKARSAVYPQLFRGMSCRLVDVSQYKVGREVCVVQFMSTTTDRDVAKGFAGGAGTLLMLQDAVGIDIGRYSPFDEKEILIVPNTVFPVRSAMENRSAKALFDTPHDVVVLGPGMIHAGAAVPPVLQAALPIIDGYNDVAQLRAYTRALEANASAEAWNGIGVSILRTNGRKNGTRVLCGVAYEAKTCFQTALEMGPRQSCFWTNLSNIGGGRVGGHTYDGKACAEQAVELDGTNAHAWSILGFKDGGTVGGTLYDAKQCYLKALEIDGKNSHAWSNLAAGPWALCYTTPSNVTSKPSRSTGRTPTRGPTPSIRPCFEPVWFQAPPRFKEPSRGESRR